MDVKKQWIDHGSVASQRPEVLSLKLTSSEWQIVTILQHILKQFTIATNQLQGDPSVGRPNIGRFEKYFPTINLLLNHLETAVNGWIIDTSSEASGQSFEQVNIFESLLAHPPPLGTTCSQNAFDFDILLTNEPANSSLIESLSEAGLAKISHLLRKTHFNCLF
jgi:hypothetical protein